MTDALHERPPSTGADAALLSIDNLAVAAGGRVLLQHFQLQLNAGDSMVVSGPSGLGKTTLLRTIAGLVDPADGTVTLHGRSPAAIGWPNFRRQVCYLHQKPVVLEGDVADNLRMPLEFHGVRRAFDRAAVLHYMQQLLLDEAVLDQSARNLSVGQQQRLALVRALLIEPAVLLLDEPTSALDDRAADALTVLLNQQRHTRGLALIIAAHDVQQIRPLTDRVVNLQEFAAAPQPTSQEVDAR